MDSREFLLALFGDAPSPDNLIVVWGKASGARWCESVEDAARATADLTQKEDVYFGVSLQSAALNGKLSSQRGRADSTSGIGGLWVDIDWQGDGHKKTGLPRNRQDAMSLLSFLPAQPTVVLETGGGIHAWWMFEEPWLFLEEGERIAAARLARGWQDVVAQAAKVRGWNIDRTHDLSRVLRLPGSLSHKHGKIVVAISADGPRYNPGDFDVWMPETIGHVGLEDKTSEVHGHGLVLDADAEPPSAKLLKLMELDACFEKTWKRRRRDLPSQSEYDMAIANALVSAGWTDQQVVNALIAHRREGGGEPKLRPGYYAGTLAAVRRDRNRADARSRLHEKATERVFHVEHNPSSTRTSTADGLQPKQTVKVSDDPVDKAEQPAIQTDQRASMLSDLSAALGTEVLGLRRYPGDPPTFELALKAGRVTLGDAEGVMSFRSIRKAVANATGIVLDPMKNHEWLPLARALLAICEDVSLGDQDSPATALAVKLASYLRSRGVAENVEAGLRGRMPFDGPHGRVYVRLDDFGRWLRVDGDSPQGRVLARWMRGLGAAPETVNYKESRSDRWSATHAWRVPDHVLRQAGVTDTNDAVDAVQA